MTVIRVEEQAVEDRRILSVSFRCSQCDSELVRFSDSEEVDGAELDLLLDPKMCDVCWGRGNHGLPVADHGMPEV